MIQEQSILRGSNNLDFKANVGMQGKQKQCKANRGDTNDVDMLTFRACGCVMWSGNAWFRAQCALPPYTELVELELLVAAVAEVAERSYAVSCAVVPME